MVAFKTKSSAVKFLSTLKAPWRLNFIIKYSKYFNGKVVTQFKIKYYVNHKK